MVCGEAPVIVVELEHCTISAHMSSFNHSCSGGTGGDTYTSSIFDRVSVASAGEQVSARVANRTGRHTTRSEWSDRARAGPLARERTRIAGAGGEQPNDDDDECGDAVGAAGGLTRKPVMTSRVQGTSLLWSWCCALLAQTDGGGPLSRY